MSNTANLVVIGSYADAAEPGLYVGRYDAEHGRITITEQVDGLRNPTFLDIDPVQSIVYTIAEAANEAGDKCGEAAAYRLDTAAGKLSLINRAITVPAPTCHLTLDRTRRSVIVASYHGGMIGLSPVQEDGGIGALAELHQHEGASVLPVQDRPRAHSVTLDAANRYAVACDLGLDRLIVYALDADARRLTRHSETAIAPGSGPRHFAFHPSQPFGYVINELNSTITALRYDAAQGVLTEIQTVSTLPEGYAGESATADIHLSPDGRFLYGSNRGHDSLAVYAVGEDGLLTLVEHAPTLGGHPRNFGIAPDGRFVLVANRDGNHVVTFRRDAETGKLTPTGDELHVSKPVCVKFLA